MTKIEDDSDAVLRKVLAFSGVSTWATFLPMAKLFGSSQPSRPPNRERDMRRYLALLLPAAFLLAACGQSPPSPAATSIPGTSSPSAAASSTSPNPAPSSTPTPTPTPTPTAAAALLGQSLDWSDGVSMEITKIKRGKVTADHVDWNSSLKVGQAYVIVTVKVTNGSDDDVDLLAEASASYGPDGVQAEDTYLSEQTEAGAPDGLLPAGKARSGFWVFLISAKYQNDVVLGLTPSLDHDEATLTGSLISG